MNKGIHTNALIQKISFRPTILVDSQHVLYFALICPKYVTTDKSQSTCFTVRILLPLVMSQVCMILLLHVIFVAYIQDLFY